MSQLSQDLAVHDSEVIVDSLVENHVINNLIDLFSNCSDLVDSFLINLLQQSVDLFIIFNLIDQVTKKTEEFFVLKIDAKEEEVEKSHGVCFYEICMLTDTFNDFEVQGCFSFLDFFAKAVCLFKSICNLMVEVYFMLKLVVVLR
jgi:hypothetical protein